MSKAPSGRKVPAGRIHRATRLGGVAGSIAANALFQGAGKLLRGERPSLSSLLLTPANISKLTNQLATMRGAAMKLGQLISMDSGDLLPKELATILARLREDADPMPKQQLIDVLTASWGKHWQDSLLYFCFAPEAAASIGQVHKAITMDGEILAIKVQYPGVRASIGSDVDNVATLIKLSGLIPNSLDYSQLLNEARWQLEQEADYRAEASMLKRYRQALHDDPFFVVPAVHSPLSTDTVLAMTFIDSVPIETLNSQPQHVRDQFMTALMQLFFRELFDFKLIQSDPNAANFRISKTFTQLVLLDFGATRVVPDSLSNHYRTLLKAAAERDNASMLEAAIAIGLVTATHSEQQQQAVVEMGMLACESLHTHGPYDFASSDLLKRTQQMGMHLSYELNFWHAPPADALFIHRKLGGLFLLAKRLGARIDMRATAHPWL